VSILTLKTKLYAHKNNNKYECTTDQELTGLLHIRTADVSLTLTRWQHSTLLRERSEGHGCHLEILMSNPKYDSASQCVFM